MLNKRHTQQSTHTVRHSTKANMAAYFSLPCPPFFSSPPWICRAGTCSWREICGRSLHRAEETRSRCTHWKCFHMCRYWRAGEQTHTNTHTQAHTHTIPENDEIYGSESKPGQDQEQEPWPQTARLTLLCTVWSSHVYTEAGSKISTCFTTFLVRHNDKYYFYMSVYMEDVYMKSFITNCYIFIFRNVGKLTFIV